MQKIHYIMLLYTINIIMCNVMFQMFYTFDEHYCNENWKNQIVDISNQCIISVTLVSKEDESI